MDIICQVCGEELGTQREEGACEICETRHHLDCWEFNGGCSLYGCPGGRGTWRSITIRPVPAEDGDALESMLPWSPASEDGERVPLPSYRDRPVIQMGASSSAIDRIFRGGHVILGGSAVVLIVLYQPMNGTDAYAMMGPFGVSIAEWSGRICIAWIPWAVLNMLWEIARGPLTPVRYYQVPLNSGNPADIISPAQIQGIQMVEKPSPYGWAAERLFGVALHLRNGDRLLVRPFDYGIEDARRVVRAMAREIGQPTEADSV